PTPCAALGPRAAGATCTFNGQCASGFCSGNKTAVCGVCAAVPGAGDACVSSNCGHGQTCVNATMTCATRGANGDACHAADPCGNDLGCVGAVASTNTPGTCQPTSAALDTPCGGGTMPGCEGSKGFFCGGAAGAKTCMAITFAGDGEACGAISNTSRVDCA